MDQQLLHFWENLATSCIGVVVALVGVWVTIGKSIVTKSEVVEMIQTLSPYIGDRQFIMERLAVNKETASAFANALQRNTEVMTELKIQIATLGKTLESIEYRIDK